MPNTPPENEEAALNHGRLLNPARREGGGRAHREDGEQPLRVKDQGSPERQELEQEEEEPAHQEPSPAPETHEAPATETCDLTEIYARLLHFCLRKHLRGVHVFLRVDDEAMFRRRLPAEPRGVWTCVS
ncbi:hypothetical protein EYF80_056044 [Liparis tanakae]|uniref:Uncharacterized protein n=1 Tax=Liparis tanakae TaxID=230148 RepID=A0A4Z2EYF7_9TELE|nr:hypothetical protein EYF80_056044 [Liparis tanakae]